MMQKDNRYIAFVCTGNTCRSPMAEGIFNKLAVEKKIDVTAESFGIATVMEWMCQTIQKLPVWKSALICPGIPQRQ